MGWHHELLVGFDLETTGTDPTQARIVSGAITEVSDGEPTRVRAWLVDPAVPIPAQATAVHGITTARARAEGRPAHEAVAEMAEALGAYWASGVPVVVYNAPFDLSLLAAELARHGLPSLDGSVGPVVDPLTVDRAVDRYRKGRRTLEAVCGVYEVALDGAHEAGADALAAVRVARAIAERYPQIAAAEPWELHRSQTAWYSQWAEGYERWLRRGQDKEAVVDRRWPVRPAQPDAVTIRTGTSAP
ncbi:3'-5' exonuclease [Streptomyces sp. RB6PN25]|uniref:3'-5' exonuclease n=1 Tax=Streptomyces humicola TaxID=2953240 RepID=A0ABT1PZM4_9ACTN|nr:3'-5' exonuclease [Streptomyces humicola]MCQ4083091.1 3'-5' exonuclease [Streptomyces humicola]